MIERIQSIFLILSALASLGVWFTGQDAILFGDNLWIQIGTILAILLSLFSLLSFRNRSRQLRLNALNSVVNGLLLGGLVYWLLSISGGIDFPEKGIEPVFIIVSLVCLVLATRYIKRDDRLVKSVDRLR